MIRSLASIAISTVLGLSLSACSDDSPPPFADAAANAADASTAVTFDAQPADAYIGPDGESSSSLGQMCSGSGQGTCPTNFFCAELEGFSGRWCTRFCDGRNDTTCPIDYPGPGFASCRLNLTDPGSGASGTVCLIICSGNSEDCPGGACDGTCPVGTTCSVTGAPSGYSACL